MFLLLLVINFFSIKNAGVHTTRLVIICSISHRPRKTLTKKQYQNYHQNYHQVFKQEFKGTKRVMVINMVISMVVLIYNELIKMALLN